LSSIAVALIPTPSIVAVDCSDGFVMDDWCSPYAPLQTATTTGGSSSSSSYIDDDAVSSSSSSSSSFQCDLLLARVLRIVRLLEQVLVEAHDDPDDDDDDADASHPGMRDTLVGSTGSSYRKAEGLEAKYEEYRVKLELQLDEERRATDRLSSLTVPPRIAHCIVADFKAFIAHVSLMKPTVSEPSVIASHGAVEQSIASGHSKMVNSDIGDGAAGKVVVGSDHDDDDHDDDGKKKKKMELEEEEERMLYPDLVLAATLGAALDWWPAPLTQWDLQAVLKGSRAFRRRCKQLSYEELFSLMAMRGTNIPLASNLFIVKRLARAFELWGAWDQLHSLEFFRHPARHLLVRWVHTVTELLTRYHHHQCHHPYHHPHQCHHRYPHQCHHLSHSHRHRC
jgi:hypothetical protein